MHEVGTDQLTLRAREISVVREGVFHFSGTRFEPCQEVSVPAFEILQYVVQKAPSSLRIHREYPAHDVVGTLLVCRVEIPRLGRWPERSNHDPCWIRAQMERLTVEEGGC